MSLHTNFAGPHFKNFEFSTLLRESPPGGHLRT
jgi:hypothetical protein